MADREDLTYEEWREKTRVMRDWLSDRAVSTQDLTDELKF